MSGEFVARMEDVLDLYQPEYNPERPVVCFDEDLPAIDWGGASAHRGCPGTGGTL